MKTLTISLALVALFLGNHGLAATSSYDEEDYEGLDYDSLVRRLSAPESSGSRDALDDVRIHAGLGMANSVFTIKHPNGDKTYVAQRGLEMSLGIDLFSRNWLAEGAFRNYGESEFENASIGLKEFDMKVVYHTWFAPGWKIRAAGGIAARYLDVNYSHRGTRYNESYQTPASVIQGGIHSYLGPRVSVGADIATRNSLVDETPDRTAFDLSIRIDGHF